MIIIGNSNVNTFKQQGVVAAAQAEKVSVLWVGALTASDFRTDHPAARKVREIFAENQEWKFLSIGTHDIHELCAAAILGRLDEARANLNDFYRQLFRDLAASGNFAWLIFPFPAQEITLPNVSDDEILGIARNFYDRMKTWCREEGIPVIDPQQRILGADGKPLPHLLQKDGIHLNVEAARIYLEEISALTGTPLQFQGEGPVFEPADEPESFASLLLNALDIPHRRGAELGGLEERLTRFVEELLRGKGLELEVDAETELVDSGLLDSLNLVETYTFAVNSIGMEIVYDVDLRTLDTVRKICSFIAEHAGGEEPDGPCFEDFVTSMRGDFSDPAQRDAILAADCRIASMEEERVQDFIRHFEIVSYSFNCNYGIIYFWLSLFAANNRNYGTALELLRHGSTADLVYPVTGEHVRYYLERWEKLQNLGRMAPQPRELPPRISVVIPSYNYGRYLDACLDSILSQNYPNLELLVLDGGSTDNTVQVIKKYEKHLSFWRSAPDAGQYSAIEEGLNKSSGEIMTWLNADDMFHPGAFHAVSRIFTASGEVEWLMGRPNSFDEGGRQKHVHSYLPLNSRAKYLSDEEFIQQEGVFWRRTLWQRSGACIDRELLLAADLELWARFFRSARLFSVDALIAGFRDHPLQKSKDKAGYTAEANRVLARERALFARESHPYSPPAPLPILLDGDKVIL